MALTFATIGGALLISPIMDQLWRTLGWKGIDDKEFRPLAWISQLLGVLERFLYVMALELGFGEFIGFWLALKVAGQWSRWSQDTKIDDRLLHSRGLYQIFLIGNALSVTYGVVGFMTFKALRTMKYGPGLLLPIVCALLSLLLLLWIRWKSRVPTADTY